MITLFKELGDQVGKEWGRYGHREDAFAEIAANELHKIPVLNSVDKNDVIAWLADSTEVPEQYVNEFGQPPINVYVADRFYIQVLVWVDSTTNIHAHTFDGAFGVLAGSSVHSRFMFHPHPEGDQQLRLGDLEFLGAELLRRGEIRRIDSGTRFIHSLFHLERPSLSVVVRTRTLQHLEPQYSYLKPCLAIDPFFASPRMVIQLRMLEALKATDSPLLWDFAKGVMKNTVPWMSYKILSTLYVRSMKEPAAWAKLVECGRTTHGNPPMDAILRCLEEGQREAKIFTLRAEVRDPSYRFFMALILNVPTRRAILDLVRQRCETEDPEGEIVKWIIAMAQQKLLPLEMDGFMAHLVNLAVRHRSFESAKKVLGDSVAEEAMQAELESLWNIIRSIGLLRPLFNWEDASLTRPVTDNLLQETAASGQ
jgi:hypothetical protein